MEYFVYFAILVVSTLLTVALAPKPPRPKPAALEDFELPTADQDRPIPVVFGTVHITGPNVVWYGDLKVQEVKKKTGGFLGVGKKKVTVGFRYFMGIHFVLCHGPVDSLDEIYVGDKLAWTPDVGPGIPSGTREILIDARNLFGGDDGEGGVFGSADILMGEPDQGNADGYLFNQLGPTLPAFRGVLSLVFKGPSGSGSVTTTTEFENPLPIGPDIITDTKTTLGGTIGNSPFPKPWAFTVSRVYKGWHGGSVWNAGTASVPVHDGLNPVRGMNGAHIIYQCLTDPEWGMGYPAALIDDESFTDAAGVMSAERMGLNLLWTQQSTIQEFVQIVLDHIGGVLYADPRTGKFRLRLIRGESAGVATGAEQALQSSTTLGDYTLISGSYEPFEFSDSLIRVSNDTNSVVNRVEAFYSETLVVNHISTTFRLTLRELDDPGIVLLDYVGPAQTNEAVFAIVPARETDTVKRRLQLTVGGVTFLVGEEAVEIDALYSVVATQVEGQNWQVTVARVGGPVFYNAIIETSSSLRVNRISFYTQGFTNVGIVEYGPIEIRGTPLDGIVGQEPEIELDETNCVLRSWERAGYGETINELTVVYRDAYTRVDTPVTVHDLANMQAQGVVINETKQYPGFSHAPLALRAAHRDLFAASTPLARGKLEVLRDGWKLVPGDLVTVSWPKLGLVSVLCRVLDIDGGTLTDGRLAISVAEDVYGLARNVYAEQDGTGFTPPTADPQVIETQSLVEANAWNLAQLSSITEALSTPATAAVALTVAAAPGDVSVSYTVYSFVPPQSFDEQDRASYAVAVQLVAALAPGDTTATVTPASALVGLSSGLLAWIGGEKDEWLRADTLDAVTGEITLTRAVLDTTPQTHAAGAQLWLVDTNIGSDDVRSAGETVGVRLVDRTSAAEGVLEDAATLILQLDGRHHRPWPPGNVQVNGEDYPETLAGALTLTWAHRDRTQQLAGLTPQSAASIGPEVGVTYSAYAYDDATNALLTSDTGLTGTSWSPVIAGSYSLRIELEAVRDSRASWQRQVRRFAYVGDEARLIETGDPRLTENGAVRQTEETL